MMVRYEAISQRVSCVVSEKVQAVDDGDVESNCCENTESMHKQVANNVREGATDQE